ncbi:GntR family transcriptional regulator, partial [Nocardia wallacei]|uniref:GntR family transcriptional regulator n=1 Tax=Nocardia wallacei TaxID=480035 RepID=UPI00245538C1
MGGGGGPPPPPPPPPQVQVLAHAVARATLAAAEAGGWQVPLGLDIGDWLLDEARGNVLTDSFNLLNPAVKRLVSDALKSRSGDVTDAQFALVGWAAQEIAVRGTGDSSARRPQSPADRSGVPETTADAERKKQDIAQWLYEEYGIDVLGLNKPGISVETAMSIRNAIVDGYAADPSIKLDGVLVARMGGKTGACIWSPSGLTESAPTFMVLNENLFANPEEFQRSMRDAVQAGRLNAPTGDPAYDSVSHEMGHLQDHALRNNLYNQSPIANLRTKVDWKDERSDSPIANLRNETGRKDKSDVPPIANLRNEPAWKDKDNDPSIANLRNETGREDYFSPKRTRGFGFLYEHFVGFKQAGKLPADTEFDEWLGQLNVYSAGRKKLTNDEEGRLRATFESWLSRFGSRADLDVWLRRAGIAGRNDRAVAAGKDTKHYDNVGTIAPEVVYRAWRRWLDADALNRLLAVEGDGPDAYERNLRSLRIFNPVEALAESNNAFGKSAPVDPTHPAYVLQALLRRIPHSQVVAEAEQRNALVQVNYRGPVPAPSEPGPSTRTNGPAASLAAAWRAKPQADRTAYAKQQVAYLNPETGFVLDELARLEEAQRGPAAAKGQDTAQPSAAPASRQQRTGTRTPETIPVPIDLSEPEDGQPGSSGERTHRTAPVPRTVLRQLIDRYIAQGRRDEAIEVLRNQFGDKLFRWISTAFTEPRAAREIADEAIEASVDRFAQIPDRDVEKWVVFVARNLMPKHAEFARFRERIQQAFAESEGAEELRRPLAEATTSELQRAMRVIGAAQRANLGRFGPGERRRGAAQPVPSGNLAARDRPLWAAVQAYVLAIAAIRGRDAESAAGSAAQPSVLQVELLRLAAQGRSDEQIAERWGLTAQRVSEQFTTIAQQLNLDVRGATLRAAGHWFGEERGTNPANLPDKLYMALTEGEKELFRMATAGKSDAEIGAVWGISTKNVTARWLGVANKLGIDFRTDLLEAAARAGVVDSPDITGPPRHDVMLSPNHIELLQLIAAGWTDKRIEKHKKLPPRTVESQLGLIAKALAVSSNRVAMVAFAIRNNIFEAPASTRAVDFLTPRDKALLELAAEGRSDREIGEMIGRTGGSIGEYFRDIRELLDAKTRSEMVAMAISVLEDRSDSTGEPAERERLLQLFPAEPPAPTELPHPRESTYLHEWLSELRRYFDVRQEDFARHAGTSTSTISRWERGFNKPRVLELRKLRTGLGLPNEFVVEALKRFYVRPDTKAADPAIQRLFWQLVASEPGSREQWELQERIYREHYSWIPSVVAPGWAESDTHRQDLIELAEREIKIAILNFAPLGDFSDLAWSTARYSCLDDYFARRFPDLDENTRKLAVRVETYIRRNGEPDSISDLEIAQAVDLDLAQVARARAIIEQRWAAGQPLSKKYSAILRKALSDNPDSELAVQVVLLHFLEELPMTRVARRLGVSPETAQRIADEALPLVRAAFQQASLTQQTASGDDPGPDPVAIDLHDSDESDTSDHGTRGSPQLRRAGITAGDSAMADQVAQQLGTLLSGWSTADYIRDIADAVAASIRWGVGTISLTAELDGDELHIRLVDIITDHSYVDVNWYLGPTPAPVERAAREPETQSAKQHADARWQETYGVSAQPSEPETAVDVDDLMSSFPDSDEEAPPPPRPRYLPEVRATRHAATARLEPYRSLFGDHIDSAITAVSELITNSKKHLFSNAEDHGLLPEEILDVAVTGDGDEHKLHVVVTNDLAPGTAAKLPKWTADEREWVLEGGRGTPIVIQESTVAVRRLTFANGKITAEHAVEYWQTPPAGGTATAHSEFGPRKPATSRHITTGRFSRDGSDEHPNADTIPGRVYKCLFQTISAAWADGLDDAHIPHKDAETWSELTAGLRTHIREIDVPETADNPNNDPLAPHIDTLLDNEHIHSAVFVVEDAEGNAHAYYVTKSIGIDGTPQAVIFDTGIPEQTNPLDNKPVARVRTRDRWTQPYPAIDKAYLAYFTIKHDEDTPAWERGALQPIPHPTDANLRGTDSPIRGKPDPMGTQDLRNRFEDRVFRRARSEVERSVERGDVDLDTAQRERLAREITDDVFAATAALIGSPTADIGRALATATGDLIRDHLGSARLRELLLRALPEQFRDGEHGRHLAQLSHRELRERFNALEQKNSTRHRYLLLRHRQGMSTADAAAAMGFGALVGQSLEYYAAHEMAGVPASEVVDFEETLESTPEQRIPDSADLRTVKAAVELALTAAAEGDDTALAKLRAAIGRLGNPRWEQYLELRFLQGLPTAEVAAAMDGDRTLRAARKLQRRAVRALADDLPDPQSLQYDPSSPEGLLALLDADTRQPPLTELAVRIGWSKALLFKFHSAIVANRLAVDESACHADELADYLGTVSKRIVMDTYRQLARDGYLRTKARSGPVVTDRKSWPTVPPPYSVVPLTAAELHATLFGATTRTDLAARASRESWQVVLGSELRRAITDGRLAQGRRLPSAEELAEHLQHVSPATVRLAFAEVAAEGYLKTSVTGTVVLPREQWPNTAPVAIETSLTPEDLLAALAADGPRNQLASRATRSSIALASELRRAITDGRLAQGRRLPTAEDLAEQFEDVPPQTVRRAFKCLADEGYLRPEHTSGPVVSPRDRWAAVKPGTDTKIPLTPEELLAAFTGDPPQRNLAKQAARGGSWHTALASELRLAITDGRLAEGQLLPTNEALAEYLSLTVDVVRLAYQQLATEGYAVARRSIGTRVTNERQWPNAPAAHGAMPLTAEEMLAALTARSSQAQLASSADREGWRATLISALRAAIVDGRLPEGRRLPTAETVAETLGVSTTTVKNVYRHLAQAGYLLTRRSIGTEVASEWRLASDRPTDGTEPASGPYRSDNADPVAIDLGSDGPEPSNSERGAGDPYDAYPSAGGPRGRFENLDVEQLRRALGPLAERLRITDSRIEYTVDFVVDGHLWREIDWYRERLAALRPTLEGTGWELWLDHTLSALDDAARWAPVDPAETASDTLRWSDSGWRVVREAARPVTVATERDAGRELRALERERDELTDRLGLRSRPGTDPPMVPIGEAIATLAARSAARRATIAARLGVDPAQLERALLPGTTWSMKLATDAVHGLLRTEAWLARLSAVLERHRTLTGSTRDGEAETLVPAPYAPAERDEAILDFEAAGCRTDGLERERADLATRLEIDNPRELTPRAPVLAARHEATEREWIALAADLRVDPAVLADLPLDIFGDPASLPPDDPLRPLAERFRKASEHRAQIMQRANDIHRLRQVVDEHHEAARVLDDEVSRRSHHMFPALSGEWVTDHVKYEPGTEDRPGTLHVVAMGGMHRRALAHLVATKTAEYPELARVLEPTAPFKIFHVTVAPSTDGKTSYHAHTTRVEPEREPTPTEIGTMLLHAYLTYRLQELLPEATGFGQWLAPIGPINSETTLADLAARLTAQGKRSTRGPAEDVVREVSRDIATVAAEPFSAREVARRLVDRQFTFNSFWHQPLRDRPRAESRRSIEIGGITIDIWMAPNGHGGFEIAQPLYPSEQPGVVVSRVFDGWSAGSERELANTVAAALKRGTRSLTPDTRAAAESDSTETFEEWQQRFTRELERAAAWVPPETPRSQITALRRRVEGMAPEFRRLGHGDWCTTITTHLAQLEQDSDSPGGPDTVAIDLDSDRDGTGSLGSEDLRVLRDAVAARLAAAGAVSDFQALRHAPALIDELKAARHQADTRISADRLRLLEQFAHTVSAWLAWADEVAEATTAHEQGRSEGTADALRARQGSAEIRLGVALAAVADVAERPVPARPDTPGRMWPADHLRPGETERLRSVAEAVFAEMATASEAADPESTNDRQLFTAATRRYDALRDRSDRLEELLAFAEQPDAVPMGPERLAFLIDHFRAVSELLTATESRDLAAAAPAAPGARARPAAPAPPRDPQAASPGGAIAERGG